MNFTQFLLFVTTLLLTWNCSSAQKQEQRTSQQAQPEVASPSVPFQNISVSTFKEKMDGEDVVILDVRTPQEISQGKIGDALEINVLESDFMNKVQELDPNKTYLVYCKVGGRSSRACDMMAKAGFKNLYNLDGGYTAWEAER